MIYLDYCSVYFTVLSSVDTYSNSAITDCMGEKTLGSVVLNDIIIKCVMGFLCLLIIQ